MSKHVPPPSGEPLDGFNGLAAAVSPAWHQAIVRLANASERVATKLGWILEHEQDDDPTSEYVKNCRELVEMMLEFLDGLEDTDTDTQCDDDPCDDVELEPSLCGVTVAAKNMPADQFGDDRELEEGNDEP